MLATALIARDTDILSAKIKPLLSKNTNFYAKILQTHYKPYSRARLVGEFSTNDTGLAQEHGYFFLGIYSNISRAKKKYQGTTNNENASHKLKQAFLLTDWNAVLWVLPSGPRLEDLACFFEPKLFDRFIQKQIHISLPTGYLPELIRYVPHQRALFRATTVKEILYIKCYRIGQDDQAESNINCLVENKSYLRFETPSVIFHDTEVAAICMSNVKGNILSEYMQQDSSTTFFEVGKSLASLHKLELKHLPSWSLEQELKAVNMAMAEVVLIDPTIKSQLLRLLESLKNDMAIHEGFKPCPIHANLFGDQILIHTNKVGIVDWDDLCHGDPLYDLGRLIAHVLYCNPKQMSNISALLAGYTDQTKTKLNSARLNWHITHTLLMRSKISSLRKLSHDWRKNMTTNLKLANDIYTKNPNWT